jgi:hypothetical protein
LNARIQVMVESRQLEKLPAHDAEVIGMWAKAVRSFRSSLLPELDRDASFTLAYQAALQLATALVRAAGYRTRGEAHHHHTFAAVAALGLGDLSDAARDLNVIRQHRHSAIYDWEGATSEQDLATVRASTLRFFAAGRTWLASARPALTAGLSDSPRTSG